MDWRNYANTRGIGIIRRSHARQKENCSDEIQRLEIERGANELGIEIVSYDDFIESSKNSGSRKKYQEALRRARRIGADHIFFYMTDREARNLTDVEANQEAVLRGDIVLHYVKDRKCLHKYSPESEFQLREFQAVIDKSWSRKLSVRTTATQDHKVREGIYPGNKGVLGYLIGKAQGSKWSGLVPNPDIKIREWVNREFELYTQGMSFKAIRDACIKEGLVPADQKKSYWQSSVERRIKDPVYFGKFRWNDEVYDGSHEVIIPSSILQKAKQRLEGRKTYGRRDFSGRGMMANGWLKCGGEDCGCAVIFDPKPKVNKQTGLTKVYNYYHCTNGRGVHVNMKGMNITEERLWEQFEKSLDEITITKMLAKQVAAALNESHKNTCKETLAEIDEFEKRLDSLDGRKSQLVDAVLDGLISREDMNLRKRSLEEERAAILEKLRVKQVAITNKANETAKSILELAIDAKSLWKERSAYERIEFLKMILSNPTWDGVSVQYEMKKPFALLREMKRLENWRP